MQGDLHDPAAIAELGGFDVVWCTGVVYHSPNPFGQLEHLRRLCERDLLLGSHVIPEVPGIEQACIWFPAISDDARAAFRQAHGGARAPSRVGVTEPFDPGAGYSNYWWGISPSALRAMVEAAGFEVLEEHFWTHLPRRRPRQAGVSARAPEVSVVVATFNRAPLLTPLLEGLRAQGSAATASRS